MKKNFWLLDITSETSREGPEVQLWAIDEAGKRVMIVDHEFHPYFYLLPKSDLSIKDIMAEVEGAKAGLPHILKVEAVNRKFFGKPMEVVKVICDDPEVVPKYADTFSKLESVREVLEDDLRFSTLYLIDKGVVPCGWHEIEVEELKSKVGFHVDEVLIAKSSPKPISLEGLPKLRVLGFSILCYSPIGEPKPERDSVVIISIATNNGTYEQFVMDNSNEKTVIESFVSSVQRFDPDIILGYGVNNQDYPYLSARAEKLGVKLALGRDSSAPHRSVYGHFSIAGRANIDLRDYAEEYYEVKVKTLRNVAEFLGVSKPGEGILIDEIEIPNYWEDPTKRRVLLEYSIENTKNIMGIADKTLDFAIQLSNFVGLPLDHVGTAATGFKVEALLIRRAKTTGELVPKRTERPFAVSYVGGLVLKPKPGVHENIAVLDFKSLYPNIMIHLNISPDTYVPESEKVKEEEVNVAPEVGHRFRKAPLGFYSKILSYLIEIRDDIRRTMAKEPRDSLLYRILDARQKAVKVITNAMYGYAGWTGARWYFKPVAEATTAWGRFIIQETIEVAKKMGLEVIYGDTDSVFVKNDEEKIALLAKKVGKRFGLEIRPDKVYIRVIFTEAKKRYCGLLPNGMLDIVGLEAVRGDWTEAAKKVQESILRILLEEKSPIKAVKFFRTYIQKLRRREVPYRDLIIWKSITKPLEEYAIKAPQVEAARRLADKGWEVSPGDKVGYVIVSGTGKLSERAYPYQFASLDLVDIDYYIKKQILPPALRILSLFKISKKTLLI